MLARLAFRLIAVVLAVLALSGSLAAQSYDLAAHGQQIIALDQLMRFHPGDDLAWANPALDDSSWPLIRGNETWYAQGYPKLTGSAWYRFKVILPSHAGPLALWVPLIATNFQIYADGRLIAENGVMPPHPIPRYGPNLVFPIPADLAHSGQPLSGKGMPAAMTVSLLVGTLRTLAHYTQKPSEILAAMNQRMLARSSGGFTTCLVLTVTASGTLTAANAGHIAPYLNGRELTLSNGLPLGLSAHEQYAESVFSLAADEQLTLMTDGVIEARATGGELLGFDRVKAMTTQSADSIVQAAQDFGQDDDITVMTLRLAPAGIV